MWQKYSFNDPLKNPALGQKVWYFFAFTGIDIGTYSCNQSHSFSSEYGFLGCDVTHWAALPDPSEVNYQPDQFNENTWYSVKSFQKALLDENFSKRLEERFYVQATTGEFYRAKLNELSAQASQPFGNKDKKIEIVSFIVPPKLTAHMQVLKDKEDKWREKNKNS